MSYNSPLLGVYTVQLPAAIPTACAITMKYGAEKYISTVVGDGLTAFINPIDDGSFENLIFKSGDNSLKSQLREGFEGESL